MRSTKLVKEENFRDYGCEKQVMGGFSLCLGDEEFIFLHAVNGFIS